MDADAETRMRRYARREDRWGWLGVKPSDVAALLAERDGMAAVVTAAVAVADWDGRRWLRVGLPLMTRLRAAVAAWRAGEETNMQTDDAWPRCERCGHEIASDTDWCRCPENAALYRVPAEETDDA